MTSRAKPKAPKSAAPDLSSYLRSARARAAREKRLPREAPEVVEALEEYVEARRKGETSISIAQLYDEFLFPVLHCPVTVSSVRGYVREIERGRA